MRAFNAHVLYNSNLAHPVYVSGRPNQNGENGRRPSQSRNHEELLFWRPRRNRQPRGQTMGFQPVLDCYERGTGNSWVAREEILAVGAGAELLLRIKNVKELKGEDGGDRNSLRWKSWKDASLTDGRDDITSVNLIHNPHDSEEERQHLVVGRASGTLQSITVGADDVKISSEYSTNERPVRSVHISETDTPLLAACLSSTDIALYSLHPKEAAVEPISEISIATEGSSSRTWATRFLSSDHLAIGYGVSKTPLHVYKVRPEGMSKEPLRAFEAMQEAVKIENASSFIDMSSGGKGSVYAISGLQGSRAATGDGQVFLTGWYEGFVRMHDLRSPSSAVNTFVDPIEPNAAVYSLLPLGHDRFMAGTARHSNIKVFDLRMSGVSTYPPSSWTASNSERQGYNLFLSHYSSRQRESPVYSLVAPSPSSPSIYAGLEGRAMEIDVYSMYDPHPDALLGGHWLSSEDWPRTSAARATLKGSPTHGNRLIDLGMIDHDLKGGKVYHQISPAENRPGVAGLDDRWLARSQRGST